MRRQWQMPLFYLPLSTDIAGESNERMNLNASKVEFYQIRPPPWSTLRLLASLSTSLVLERGRGRIGDNSCACRAYVRWLYVLVAVIVGAVAKASSRQ